MAGASLVDEAHLHGLAGNGPHLRLAGPRKLSKAQRYANPDGHPIYVSSFISVVLEYRKC